MAAMDQPGAAAGAGGGAEVVKLRPLTSDMLQAHNRILQREEETSSESSTRSSRAEAALDPFQKLAPRGHTPGGGGSRSSATPGRFFKEAAKDDGDDDGGPPLNIVQQLYAHYDGGGANTAGENDNEYVEYYQPDLPERARVILDFMIKDTVDDCLALWFTKSEDIARQVKQRFAEDVRKAFSGEYYQWEYHSEAVVALLILLDQFPRCISAGHVRSMWGDHFALPVALRALERRRQDPETYYISPLYMPFVLWPLSHAEDVNMQLRCCFEWSVLSGGLDRDHPMRVFDAVFDEHSQIVHKYGRFPLRNDIVARPSTPAEQEYFESAEVSAFSLPLGIVNNSLVYVRDNPRMKSALQTQYLDAAANLGSADDLQLDSVTTSDHLGASAPTYISYTACIFGEIRGIGMQMRSTDLEVKRDPFSEGIHKRARAVLGFFFKDNMDENVFLWFGKNRRIQKAISEQFAGDVERALSGEYLDWQNHPQEVVALILLLSQFTRVLWRNSERVYWGQTLAAQLALQAIDQMQEDLSFDITPVHLIWVLFALSLEENPRLQHRCCYEWDRLSRELDSEDPLRAFTGIFHFHARIVSRFGRFPHRNAVLQRKCTREEVDFLENREFFYNIPLTVGTHGYSFDAGMTHLFAKTYEEEQEMNEVLESNKRERAQLSRRSSESRILPLGRGADKHKRKASVHVLHYERGNFGEINAHTLSLIGALVHREKTTWQVIEVVDPGQDLARAEAESEQLHGMKGQLEDLVRQTQFLKDTTREVERRSKYLEKENTQLRKRLAKQRACEVNECKMM